MGDTDIAFPNLGIYLKDVPRFVTIFGYKIAMYGIIIGIGVVFAFLLVARQARKRGMNDDDFYDLGLYLLIFGVIGARLYYVIFEWDYYKNDLKEILNIREGGLAIYGGIIAGTITLFVWCKLKKQNVFQIGDVAFQGVLVGQIIGRYGNFTNREVFGGYTNNPFAMRLPINAVRYRDISEDIAAHIEPGTNYIQVHPTFLYESFYNLCLLVLIILFEKKKAFDGEVILWYLGGYGIGRFIIEGIRTDRLTIGNTNLAISQLLGISLFVFSVVMDLYVRNRKKNEMKAEA